MCKGHCVLTAVFLYIITVYSLSSKKCQQGISESDSSCVVPRPAPGYPARPRFVYDWDKKICQLVRWSWSCAEIPQGTNNFATEDECKNECSGWA